MTPPLSRRRMIGGLAALGVTALGVEAVVATRPGARLVRRSAVAFGTVVSIGLVDDGHAALEPAFAAGFEAIRAIERAANLFAPTSEIARLNRDGRVELPSADFATLVGFAKRLAVASGGAFDPTVQPIWTAWRAATRAGGVPDAETLAAAVALVDHRALRLDDDAVSFARPGMGLTLNALAQGHATDRVAAAVAAHGVAHAFLDTGEIGALGRAPSGRAWRVAIADPRRDDGSIGALDLASRRFVATSGDRACAWTADFLEHHIVEPWSGHSPRDFAEVAVVASSGLMADGLSTALMVSGRAGAAGLLALDEGAGAVLVDKGGAVRFAGHLPSGAFA